MKMLSRLLSVLIAMTFLSGMIALTPMSTAAESFAAPVYAQTFAAGKDVYGIKADGNVYREKGPMCYENHTHGMINGITGAVEISVENIMGSDNCYILTSDKTLYRYEAYNDLLTKAADNVIHISGSAYITADTNELYVQKGFSGYQKVLDGVAVADVTSFAGEYKYALSTNGSVYRVDTGEKIVGLDNTIQIAYKNTYLSNIGELYALKSNGELMVWGECRVNYDDAGRVATKNANDADGDYILTYYIFDTPYRIATRVKAISCMGTFYLVTQKTNNTVLHGIDIQTNISDVAHFSCSQGYYGFNDYATFITANGSVHYFNFDRFDDSYKTTKVMDNVLLPSPISGLEVNVSIPVITDEPYIPPTPETSLPPTDFLPGNPTGSGAANIDDILLVRDVIFGEKELTAQGYHCLGLEEGDPVTIDHILLIRDVIFGN